MLTTRAETCPELLALPSCWDVLAGAGLEEAAATAGAGAADVLAAVVVPAGDAALAGDAVPAGDAVLAASAPPLDGFVAGSRWVVGFLSAGLVAGKRATSRS